MYSTLWSASHLVSWMEMDDDDGGRLEGACPSVFAITPCHDTVARQIQKRNQEGTCLFYRFFHRFAFAPTVALFMKLGQVVLEDQEMEDHKTNGGSEL